MNILKRRDIMEIKKELSYSEVEDVLVLSLTTEVKEIEEKIAEVFEWLLTKEGFEVTKKFTYSKEGAYLYKKDIEIRKNFSIDNIEDAENAVKWFRQKIGELKYQAEEFVKQLEEL